MGNPCKFVTIFEMGGNNKNPSIGNYGHVYLHIYWHFYSSIYCTDIYIVRHYTITYVSLLYQKLMDAEGLSLITIKICCISPFQNLNIPIYNYISFIMCMCVCVVESIRHTGNIVITRPVPKNRQPRSLHNSLWHDQNTWRFFFFWSIDLFI